MFDWVPSACREISKPLVPLGKAAALLVKILKLLCKGMVCPASAIQDSGCTEGSCVQFEGQLYQVSFPLDCEEGWRHVGGCWTKLE